MEPFSHLHEHSGGMPREVWATDTQYMPGPVSSMQICSRERCFSSQLLVTSYIIIVDLCLAMLHAWTLKYQHMMLCVYEGRKAMANWRRPPGRPRNVWLNKVQEDASAMPLTTLCRSEIARGHWVAQRFTQTMRWWYVTTWHSVCSFLVIFDPISDKMLGFFTVLF